MLFSARRRIAVAVSAGTEVIASTTTVTTITSRHSDALPALLSMCLVCLSQRRQEAGGARVRLLGPRDGRRAAGLPRQVLLESPCRAALGPVRSAAPKFTKGALYSYNSTAAYPPAGDGEGMASTIGPVVHSAREVTITTRSVHQSPNPFINRPHRLNRRRPCCS